jgi:hypothetical protein
MSSASLLLSLIRRYVDVAASFAAKLREELGQQDLLSAVSSRKVPRGGTLHGGARYHFHGIGCSIEDPTLNIDFDFGPKGRSDGFDAWRLLAFARQLPEFSALHDRKVIENGLEELRRDGTVVQPHWAPSPHLFYLAVDDNGARREDAG